MVRIVRLAKSVLPPVAWPCDGRCPIDRWRGWPWPRGIPIHRFPAPGARQQFWLDHLRAWQAQDSGEASDDDATARVDARAPLVQKRNDQYADACRARSDTAPAYANAPFSIRLHYEPDREAERRRLLACEEPLAHAGPASALGTVAPMIEAMHRNAEASDTRVASLRQVITLPWKRSLSLDCAVHRSNRNPCPQGTNSVTGSESLAFVASSTLTKLPWYSSVWWARCGRDSRS